MSILNSNKPEYIIVHHTAVSYNKNPDQFEATKRYHKSLGWGDIGYHYEINKAGKVYVGRKETTAGAHCYQESMNSKSIGIALDGNFDEELPTKEQTEALKKLLIDICARHKISKDKIYPHRKYATYKSCYGKKLSDKWASDLVDSPKYDEKLAARLDRHFLLSVDEGGIVYYVIGGKKIRVPAGMAMEKFVIQYGLVTGIKRQDLDKIESA